MFKNAKVGDRVWGFRYGWGTITSTSHLNVYPLFVLFDNGKQESFTIEGKIDSYDDKNPTLFWNEIKFEIPEKPFDLEAELKRLEIKEFEHGDKNYYLYWDNAGRKIYYDIVGNNEQPNIEYFSEENINNFMKNIRYKKITKEQFFVAYKNVFGGR